MRQRTGLAAAMVGQPKLLVLDEPTDGIDPVGRRQIREVIVAAASAGTTLFLNSHLLAETERVCDHVAVLFQGKVVVSGPLSILQRKDSFRVAFAPQLRDGGDATAAAAAHGFVVAEPDSAAERLVTRYAGTDARALSQSLAAAIAAGLTVTELAPELVELETLLEQSMTKPASALPNASGAA
jgi:ABC-2 type transport system ATP-binding protein